MRVEVEVRCFVGLRLRFALLLLFVESQEWHSSMTGRAVGLGVRVTGRVRASVTG